MKTFRLLRVFANARDFAVRTLAGVYGGIVIAPVILPLSPTSLSLLTDTGLSVTSGGNMLELEATYTTLALTN